MGIRVKLPKKREVSEGVSPSSITRNNIEPKRLILEGK